MEAGSFPWLSRLPRTLELPGMLLFHGTPLEDDRYLLETVHPAVHSNAVTLASDDEIADRLKLNSGTIAPNLLLLCGHTHIPRVVEHGTHLIVNPGSVGLQAYQDTTPIPTGWKPAARMRAMH